MDADQTEERLVAGMPAQDVHDSQIAPLTEIIFAARKIMNPKLARSQLIGAMTLGMSMALLEESVLDREFGDYLNHDLAQYHIPVNAAVPLTPSEWSL